MNTEIQPTTLEQFTQIVYQAAKTRYRHFSNTSVEKEQIDYEIEVFSIIPGYIDYLLILKGLVEAVKAKGFPVGPGYGASPASLITYCLGITGIDPTENDSLFELFADKEQKNFPTITLEFGDGGVAFAYKYLQNTLGTDKVARLMIAHDYLTCSHILFSLNELKQIVPVRIGKSEGNVFNAVKKYDLKHNCKGQVFQVTVLTNWHLDEISKSIELINERHQIEIRTEDLPLDDKDTLALFSSGDTADIPFFDNERMQMYLKSLQACSFKDLMALNSLYVPGRMNQIPLLIKRNKLGFSSGRQMHLLDEILEDTYGIIVYREQMELFTLYAFGVSKKDIKSLKNASKTHNIVQLSILKDEYLKLARLKEVSEEDFEMVWDCWSNHYGSIHLIANVFCRTLTSYRKAWFKAHYRNEFQMARLIIARRRDIVNSKSDDPFIRK